MRVTWVAIRLIGYAAGLALTGAGTLVAQRATQVVSFRVEAIQEVSVEGSPSLTISSAIAGQAPTSVTASGSTWNVSTNLTGAKVTASLESDMPSGVTLSIDLAPPPGATSAGRKPLGAAPVDLVTNVTKLTATHLPLSYRLDATPRAGIVTAGTRVVTFTITGGV
ncbi:MAG: hypothetical protein JWM41_3852 [Gemmatimonadetes bacterium]|nr:hypothetical protein [Gemmatimonadota bacterium]